MAPSAGMVMNYITTALNYLVRIIRASILFVLNTVFLGYLHSELGNDDSLVLEYIEPLCREAHLEAHV